MKTGTQNHKMFAILLCVSFFMVSNLACRVPGRGRPADEEPQAVLERRGEDQITDADQDETQPALPCYPGIIPGKSTRAEVIGLLDQPVYHEQEGNTERLFYSSPISGQNNIIELEDDLINHISIVFADAQIPRLTDLQARLGQPEHTTYSTYLRGSRTYLYPQQGLLLIADPLMDTVFIQECFQPQSLGNFVAHYGAGLPEDDPYIRGAVTVDEAPLAVDEPVGAVTTERKILEPLMVYPGARVIYDADDKFTEAFGFLIFAVDAPMAEVVKFYQANYQEGFWGIDPDEIDDFQGFLLINHFSLDENENMLDYYQSIVEAGSATYSLGLITILHASDFDGPEILMTRDYTIEDYSFDETLIIFQLTHLQNYLALFGEG